MLSQFTLQRRRQGKDPKAAAIRNPQQEEAQGSRAEAEVRGGRWLPGKRAGDRCSSCEASCKLSTKQLEGPEEAAMAFRSELVQKEQEAVLRGKAHSVDFQKG